MKLTKNLTIENIDKKALKSDEYGEAAFTHYLHNSKNGVSQFFKKEAVN